MIRELNKNRNDLYEKYQAEETAYEEFKKADRELNKALIEMYPFLMPKNVFTSKVPDNYDYQFCLFKDEIPFGWWKRWGLEFLEDLNSVLVKHNFVNDLCILQVKEKYGGLRFYTGGIPDEWDEHEHAWEHISEHTCINCGKFPVKMRDDGWVCPWCDECFEKHGPTSKELREECTIKNDFIKDHLEIKYYTADKDEIRKIDMLPYYKKIGYEWGECSDIERREDVTN